jgi:hypothetical protein
MGFLGSGAHPATYPMGTGGPFPGAKARPGSRVSSGSIVSDYGMDDRAIGVRSPAGAKHFSCILCVQTGSGAHPASCTMGTGGPFPTPGFVILLRYLVALLWVSYQLVTKASIYTWQCNTENTHREKDKHRSMPRAGVKRGQGVMLTTHPDVVPRSWMSRSYTSSPPSASMACSGTALKRGRSVTLTIFCRG